MDNARKLDWLIVVVAALLLGGCKADSPIAPEGITIDKIRCVDCEPWKPRVATRF